MVKKMVGYTGKTYCTQMSKHQMNGDAINLYTANNLCCFIGISVQKRTKAHSLIGQIYPDGKCVYVDEERGAGKQNNNTTEWTEKNPVEAGKTAAT